MPLQDIESDPGYDTCCSAAPASRKPTAPSRRSGSASRCRTGGGQLELLLRRHVTPTALVFGLLASIVACSGSPTAPSPILTTNTELTPARLTIDFPSSAFDVGETGQFRANLVLSNGATREDVAAEWQSSNTVVATVSDTGVVTAWQPGTFDLRATAEGLTARLTGFHVATPVDSRFDDTFWRQMVYNEFETGYTAGTSRVLANTSPDVHIVDAPDRVDDLIARALPRLVQQLTGAPYVGTLYVSATRRMSPYRGIDVVLDDSLDRPSYCGQARTGALEGLISLRRDCSSYEQDLFDNLFAHEFGHAMGFYHTDQYSTNLTGQDCMSGGGSFGWNSCNSGRGFTPREQYHAQLAYRVGRGIPYCGWPLGKGCYGQSSAFDSQIGSSFVVD